MDGYDAYHLWLGIPPEEQPPSHYRLLGVRLFEQNSEVIRNAADRQRSHVKRLGVNQYQEIGQNLLNEIEAAKICLMRPEKRAPYDERLRTQLDEQAPEDSAERSAYEQQLKEETLIVGSDRHCDIVIDLPIISGVHCSVMRRDKHVILRDLKSTNGTFVNHRRVESPTRIVASDLVVLGRDTRLKLPIEFFPVTERSTRAAFIGRNDQCEFHIADATVSAFHARLTFGRLVEVEDLGSTNGTYVIGDDGRGSRIQPLTPIPIEEYPTVAFGKHRMSVAALKEKATALAFPWCEETFPLTGG